MKFVIIGGSGQSTPWLFKYLSSLNTLPHCEAVLVGRSPERLRAVVRASKMFLRDHRVSIYAEAVERLGHILKDADVVIFQVRVGGYKGRSFDETFPLKYGICGDEGLGPGGLSAAWRAWPEIAELLELVATSSPGALVLLLSSPVSILTRAANATFNDLTCVGICELPWVLLLNLAHSIGVDLNDITFDYFGVNHLGWFYNTLRDQQPLNEIYAATRTGDEFPTREFIQATGFIPTRYLRLHYQRAEVIEEQRRMQISRGDELVRISAEVFRKFETGTVNEINRALEMRSAPWYEYGVGPVLASRLTGQKNIPVFLSVHNNGLCSGFEPDDILEIPHTIDGRVLRAIRLSAAVPNPLIALTKSFVQYERLATAAILSRKASEVNDALAVHPWVQDLSKVPELANEIISQSME